MAGQAFPFLTPLPPVSSSNEHSVTCTQAVNRAATRSSKTRMSTHRQTPTGFREKSKCFRAETTAAAGQCMCSSRATDVSWQFEYISMMAHARESLYTLAKRSSVCLSGEGYTVTVLIDQQAFFVPRSCLHCFVNHNEERLTS